MDYEVVTNAVIIIVKFPDFIVKVNHYEISNTS